MSGVHRHYVDVEFGQLHVAEAGPADGVPVVLLHQTPRSWDEFAEVLCLLGRTRRAVAVDLPGMGASDAHPDGASIENYAAGVLAAVDGLGAGTFDLVGHHTGGVVAVEVAARAPDRVRHLVLSSTPYVDADGRRARRGRDPIDAVQAADDGCHLAQLWDRRRAFYPPGRPDLLNRFIRDALRAQDPEQGHVAVARYRMEERLPLVRARVFLVGHDADPYAFPEMSRMLVALGQPEHAVIDGGMVPLEFSAARFAEIVEKVLAR